MRSIDPYPEAKQDSCSILSSAITRRPNTSVSSNSTDLNAEVKSQIADDGSELFGDNNGYKNGFDALKARDSNN